MWLCQAAMNLIQSMWPSRVAAFRHFHMWLCQAAMNLVYGFLPWCHVVTIGKGHMSGLQIKYVYRENHKFILNQKYSDFVYSCQETHSLNLILNLL